MNNLERAVLSLIEKVYKCKYVGGLTVTQLASGGYKLALNLGNPDIEQIVIAADMNAEDFLKYVKQELISRQLIKVQYFTGYKYEPGDERPNTC